MKAGAAVLDDTAPRATGRSDGRDREVWMQFEPCCPDGVLNVRRRAHGEKGAADRDSSHPTGRTSCPNAGLSLLSAPSFLSRLCLDRKSLALA